MTREELFGLFIAFTTETIMPDLINNQYTALYLKGGWEGWAQVEVSKFLLRKGIPVEREYLLNDCKIDLYVGNEWFVELKCQSLGNGKALLGGVASDLLKIRSKVSDIHKAVIFWSLDNLGNCDEMCASLYSIFFDMFESDPPFKYMVSDCQFGNLSAYIVTLE